MWTRGLVALCTEVSVSHTTRIKTSILITCTCTCTLSWVRTYEFGTTLGLGYIHCAITQCQYMYFRLQIGLDRPKDGLLHRAR